MLIMQSHCILTFQVLTSVNSGKNTQWLEACCWTNEWRNGQFNKQTNETSSLNVEWNRRNTGTPEDPTGQGGVSSDEAPESQNSSLPSPVPSPKGYATALFFPGDPDSLLSPLHGGDVWFYCQHDISNEKQMVSNATWKKEMHKQQQNYMFFFPVVFTGRVCDLFAVNTAYNDMVHRSTAKSVWHSLHTCIKCNAIGVWRLSNRAECCPGANAELQRLFLRDHKRGEGRVGSSVGGSLGCRMFRIDARWSRQNILELEGSWKMCPLWVAVNII